MGFPYTPTGVMQPCDRFASILVEELSSAPTGTYPLFLWSEDFSRTPNSVAFLRILFGGRPSRFAMSFNDIEAAASSINRRSSLKDQREGFRF
jgi:hypothetical protein